jgi:hypothetical protein
MKQQRNFELAFNFFFVWELGILQQYAFHGLPLPLLLRAKYGRGTVVHHETKILGDTNLRSFYHSVYPNQPE